MAKPFPLNLLELSAPESRRPGAALVAGLFAGFTSAGVKMGWESILPPRKPGQEPPPVTLLKQRGVDVDGLTYEYHGNEVGWGGLAVHFGFSMSVIGLYSVLAEYLPRVTLLKGVAYGLGVWVVAHEIALPALKLTAPAKDLPLQEQVSEFLGHIVWALDAEFVRHGVRGALTGVADADTREAALTKVAEFAARGVKNLRG